MEIVTIPLSGYLTHTDSMGRKEVIQKGMIQVMSAGSGIWHSEMNEHDSENAELLQIWVFPNERDVEPKYNDKNYELSSNVWTNIVGPKGKHPNWIHQDAWFCIAQIEKGTALNYDLKDPAHGVFLFVIEGAVKTGEQILSRRDALEITDTDTIKIEIEADALVLAIEVPV